MTCSAEGFKYKSDMQCSYKPIVIYGSCTFWKNNVENKLKRKPRKILKMKKEEFGD